MPTRVGFRLRSLALAMDLAVVLLLSALFAPWLGLRLGLGSYGGGPGAGGMMSGATAGTALIGLLYFASEVVAGVTLGKRVLGLRIGTAEGRVAPRDQYLLRWLLKHAPTLVALLTVLLSLVLPVLTGWLMLLSNLAGLAVVGGCFLALGTSRQALHDRLADTAVFRVPLLPREDVEAAETD
jgi:uncharacterized RDD family membrane protein YckC